MLVQQIYIRNGHTKFFTQARLFLANANFSFALGLKIYAFIKDFMLVSFDLYTVRQVDRIA